MSRNHALCGVSLIAIQLACIAVVGPAHSQSAEPTALPPVNIDAPREARAKPAAPKRSGTAAAGPRRTPQQASAPARQLPVVVINTSSVGSGNLYQAPNGQTGTTIDRSQFENRPAFSVADVLRDSPGISIKQGNGPRDFGISIRGSNARNGFGIRNMVIFDDGFPVTQPDGLSRSDLIDPHAYGAIDVIRGPSSALYGNYATGGAINFRMRPGR
ncbi:MAG TPA: TonB-dependent receptor plug domain-containing protein, partial [Bradyrhizobium sp.]|nr:TonB-dependent receptor plug domain-containing protein [Bradyrhizobium sp.]